VVCVCLCARARMYRRLVFTSAILIDNGQETMSTDSFILLHDIPFAVPRVQLLADYFHVR
jgi:hypothetical protein